jgi:hypothetical protein
MKCVWGAVLMWQGQGKLTTFNVDRTDYTGSNVGMWRLNYEESEVDVIFQVGINNFKCCTVHSDIYTVHTPTNAILLNLEEFKIYFKIHINIAPTCFGLRPSSGSLNWSLAKVILKHSV